MSVIVGLSAHYHDSACCVLKDGRLVAAAQEERFTRRKHDRRMPALATRHCLDAAGVSISDVDVVAYYEDPDEKAERQRWALERWGGAAAPRVAPEAPIGEIRELLGYEGPVDVFKHHESHAASAFFYSGFREAALLVVDGVGEWATTSYGRGRDGDIELREQVRFPHSLGLFYAAVTAFLGFEVNDGEYKVMGLAPYGRPRYAERLRSVYEMASGGQFRLRTEYFDFARPDRMYSDELATLLGRGPRAPESELDEFAADLASSLQCVLEEVMLAKARYAHERAPSDALCLAGGVALNCVSNGRLLREGPFRRLFVQPAAGDAGGALGAAALSCARRGGAPACGPLRSLFLGPSYSNAEIVDLLADADVEFESFEGRERDLLETVAASLAEGDVVAWFQGAMEFGPRALGNRSILADPRRADMRDRINRAVKMREAFRPFAPAVLASEASAHFDLDHEVPFMLETCRVRGTLDLPAVTHVDGSARPQTVDADVAPRFAALLRAFERRTGCPVLLNTSLNRRGEPIVAAPLDALACFIGSGLDRLVLGDVVIDRARLPTSWVDRFGSWDVPDPRPGSGVYSLY